MSLLGGRHLRITDTTAQIYSVLCSAQRFAVIVTSQLMFVRSIISHVNPSVWDSTNTKLAANRTKIPVVLIQGTAEIVSRLVCRFWCVALITSAIQALNNLICWQFLIISSEVQLDMALFHGWNDFIIENFVDGWSVAVAALSLLKKPSSLLHL